MKRPKFTGKDTDHWLLTSARRWGYPINLKNIRSEENKTEVKK